MSGVCITTVFLFCVTNKEGPMKTINAILLALVASMGASSAFAFVPCSGASNLELNGPWFNSTGFSIVFTDETLNYPVEAVHFNIISYTGFGSPTFIGLIGFGSTAVSWLDASTGETIEVFVGSQFADIWAGTAGLTGHAFAFGLGGDDTLDGIAGVPGFSADYIHGGPGDDTLTGHEGDDIMEGGVGIDDMFGNDGADIMYGGPNDDLMYGGDDSDILYGEDGRDGLDGEDKADSLYGGDGNDALWDKDMTGGDYLDGEAGDDWIDSFDTASDTMVGGPGFDTAYGDIADIWGPGIVVGFLAGSGWPNIVAFAGRYVWIPTRL